MRIYYNCDCGCYVEIENIIATSFTCGCGKSMTLMFYTPPSHSGNADGEIGGRTE